MANSDEYERRPLPLHHYSPAAAHSKLVRGTLEPGATICDGIRVIRGCRFVPSRLVVLGSFDLSQNAILESIDEWLTVMNGFLDAHCCERLQAVGARLNVSLDCNFSGCERLLTIGRDLVVGRNLDITGCANVVLGANSTIGGDLLLSANYDVQRLPADLIVSGAIRRSR